MNEEMQQQIARALANLDVTGKINNMQNVPGAVVGQGRVSAGLPLGEDSKLTAGMNLTGMYSPQMKSIKPEGADLTYQSGDNKYGMQIGRPHMGPKTLSFNYSRSF